MEEIRKQTVARISEFFNGESNNAEVDTYKKLLDFEKEVIKAINYTRCCESDSELYCDDNEVTHNRYRLTDGFGYCPDCGQEL